MISLLFNDSKNIKDFSSFVYAMEYLTYSDYEKTEILNEIQRAEFGTMLFHSSVHIHIQRAYEALTVEQRRIAHMLLNDDCIIDVINAREFIQHHGLLSKLSLVDYFVENDTINVSWRHKLKTILLRCNSKTCSLTIEERTSKTWIYSKDVGINRANLDLIELYEYCTEQIFDYSLTTMVDFLKDLGVDETLIDQEFKDNLSDILL